LPKLKPPPAAGGAGVVAPKTPPPKPVDGAAAGEEEDPTPKEKPAPEVVGGLAGAGVDNVVPPEAPNAKAGGAWEAGALNPNATSAGLGATGVPPNEKGGPPALDAAAPNAPFVLPVVTDAEAWNEGASSNGAAAAGGGVLSAGLGDGALPKANKGLLDDAAPSFFSVAAGVVVLKPNDGAPARAGEVPFPAGIGNEGVPPLSKENRVFLLVCCATASTDDTLA